jgi:hypothetical protein
MLLRAGSVRPAGPLLVRRSTFVMTLRTNIPVAADSGGQCGLTAQDHRCVPKSTTAAPDRVV